MMQQAMTLLASFSPATGEQAKTFPLVLGGIALVVLIALAVVSVMAKKNGQKTDQPHEDENIDKPQE